MAEHASMSCFSCLPISAALARIDLVDTPQARRLPLEGNQRGGFRAFGSQFAAHPR
jgi:hypothetical protein